MLIPKSVKNCVAFIGYKTKRGQNESEIKLAGTVFFASYPLSNEARADHCNYAVTAGHIVDEIQKRSMDGNSYVRCIKDDGSLIWVHVPICDWIRSDDSSIDVAVTQFGLSRSHKTIPISMFATDGGLEEDGIGEGHELFFPGLFVHHAGKESNIPILRLGSIATLATERINTRECGLVKGFLAEARSIGGLSGSPVFARSDFYRFAKNGDIELRSGRFQYYLLGLVHGHYDVESVRDSTEIDSSGVSKAVNMGIAIIVAADDIRSVLEKPELVEQRSALLAEGNS